MKKPGWRKEAKELSPLLLYLLLFYISLFVACGDAGEALAAFNFFYLPAIFGFVVRGAFLEARHAAREGWKSEKREWNRGLCKFLAFLPVLVAMKYGESLNIFGIVALHGVALIFLGFGAKGAEAGSLEKVVKDVWVFLVLWLLFCLFIYGLRAWVQAQEAAAV